MHGLLEGELISVTDYIPSQFVHRNRRTEEAHQVMISTQRQRVARLRPTNEASCTPGPSVRAASSAPCPSACWRMEGTGPAEEMEKGTMEKQREGI